METQDRIEELRLMILQAADEIEDSEGEDEVVEKWVDSFKKLDIEHGMHKDENGSICNTDTQEGELMRLEMHASLIDATHIRHAHAAFPLWIASARAFFGQEA